MEAGRDHGGRMHVAMLPSSGIGHLAPLAELGRRLALRHGVSVTFIVSAADSSSPFCRTLVDSPTPGFSVIALPPVDLPESAVSNSVVGAFIAIHCSLPAVRRVLGGLKQSATGGRLAALVVDFFGTEVFEVAADVGVPSFIFFPSNLFLLSLSLNLPIMHDAMPRLHYPVELPGCLPLFSNDFPEVVRRRGTEGYEMMLCQLRRYEKAEGILVNSFRAMEAEAAAILSERKPGRPPVYLVGPLVPEEPPSPSLCSEWLDEQPNGSVLYVCLGSLGVLNDEQVKEMAFGLEKSGQRFLWVLRGLATENEDPVGCLPPGFVERTKGAGRVLTSWVPQLQILRHHAVGGFLTHCGWNSVQECVVHGRVPMIAWPLYAEQRMNALILVERLGVAIRTEGQGEDGVVRREAISEAVVELMKGERGRAARERVQELHAAAAEEGAYSRVLADVVAEWKSK